MVWPPLLAAAVLLSSAVSITRSPSVLVDVANKTLHWERLNGASIPSGNCRLGEITGIHFAAAFDDGDTDIRLFLRTLRSGELPLGQSAVATAVARVQALADAADARAIDWLSPAVSKFTNENQGAAVTQRLNVALASYLTVDS
jgi:hypothetical protein